MDEMRFVHREETFDDLAVRELAKSRAECLCRLQFGRCSRSECASCQLHRQYVSCFAAMDDYNRTRLSTNISACWSLFSQNPEAWMSRKALARGVVRYIVGMVAVLLLAVLPVACMGCSTAAALPARRPSGMLPSEVTAQTAADLDAIDRMVSDAIRDTASLVSDVNGDGRINCVDRAVTFKRIWDARHPEMSRCEIVRNRTGSFHHVFIGIATSDFMLFIEPGAPVPETHEMHRVWGEEYDPRNNVYGETEMWMTRGWL